ncbi:MAG: choice-of-anchor Q domain-containing protein, partial [Pyrinomonadaceae bacterium]
MLKDQFRKKAGPVSGRKSVSGSGLIAPLRRSTIALACVILAVCFLLGADYYKSSALVRAGKAVISPESKGGRTVNWQDMPKVKIDPQDPNAKNMKGKSVEPGVKSDTPRAPEAGGDTCAFGVATEIPSLPYNDTGTTVGATDDYDLMARTNNGSSHACPTCIPTGAGPAGSLPRGAVYTGTGTAPDVAYSITFSSPAASNSINVTMDPTGTQDLALLVYEGAPGPGCTSGDPQTDVIVVDDTGVGSGTEVVTISNMPPGTYHIVVDGYSTGGTPPGPSGPYSLTVTGTGTVVSGGMPPTTYVDDDWVGTTIGTDPDGGGGPATNFGTDSFATVQEGVDGVATGGNVIVNPGTYNEAQIHIERAMTVTGADPATTIIDGGATPIAEAGLVRIDLLAGETGNATFQGFTLRDPGLTGGARYLAFGKQTEAASTVTFDNNVLQGPNSTDYGFYSDRPRGPVVFTNNVLSNNAFNPILIERPENTTNVADNTILGNGSTAYFNMTYDDHDVTGQQRVTGNTIMGNGSGIVFNASPSFFGPGSASRAGRFDDVLISGNTITGLGDRTGIGLLNDAIDPTGVEGQFASAVISDNIIIGTNAGVSRGVWLRGLSLGALITGNSIRNMNRGINGTAAQDGHTSVSPIPTLNHIVGNTAFGIEWTGTGPVNAENNWWGCNAGPGAAGCDSIGGADGANVDGDPWIVLSADAAPMQINAFDNSVLTADLRENSDGTPLVGTEPDVAILFTATEGTMAPPNAILLSGGPTMSTFTSTSINDGTACATVDNQEVCAAIDVLSPPNIDVDPLTLGSMQLPDTVVNQNLAIENTGDQTLTWTILETDVGPRPARAAVLPSKAANTSLQGIVLGASPRSVDVLDETSVKTGISRRSDASSENENGPVRTKADMSVNGIDLLSRMGPNDRAVEGVATCATPNDYPWLSVAPGNGVTTGGTTTNVTVTTDSTGLAPGIYNANLCITSDDPDPGPGNETDLVNVPVTMEVGCIIDPVVLNNADSGAGSLRQAVIDACDGSTITFDGGVVSPVTLTTGLITISRNLTIQGPGANLLSIDGNNNSRIFNSTSPISLTVNDLTLTGGNGTGGGSTFGGALRVFNAGATLNLNSVTVTGNSASGGGGGVQISNVGTANITNSTISGNTAGFGGGGMQVEEGTVNMVNSTISGNTANSGIAGGGGVRVSVDGTVNFTSSTITNNTTAFDGGGIIRASTNPVTLRNTIVAGNFDTSGGNAPDASGDFVSSGYNLIGIADGSTGFTGTGDQTGTGATPIDPLLGPLANNGGPTMTHALLYPSPAIDAGNNFGVLTDQRGQTRPFDQVGFANATDGTDIGAYEEQVQFIIPTTTAVSSDNNPSIFGQAVTFTATVATVPPGMGTPTGTVTFNIDGNLYCVNTPLTGSTATCTQAGLPALPAGNRVVVALYNGDGIYNGSAGSLAGGQVVNMANTLTTITSDLPDPSLVNQPYTVTWTVVPDPVFPGSGTPTGTVTVDGGAGGGSCMAPVAAGSCQLTPTTVGTKTIQATYSGDANF